MQLSALQDLGIEMAAKLGVYVQTCARIEYQVASIICAIESIPRDTNEWRTRHNGLRTKNTTKGLISKLSSLAKGLEDGDPAKRYLKDISGWMHRFVGNRHKAVHGFIKKEGHGLVVRAANKDADKEDILLVSIEDISEMMEDAQRILENLQTCLTHLSDHPHRSHN